MALTANRNTPAFVPSPVRSYPVAASTKIFAGSLVCLNSSGYLVPGSTSSSLIAVGRADQLVDNSTGTDGALSCEVEQGVFRWANGSTITIASTGAICYVVDDQTVSTNASGKSVAGTICLVDSDGVWVGMGIQGPIDSSALTTFITNLAATTTAEGASLVGVEDSGSLITATNVETALAEIVKKANAADGIPTVIPIVLSRLADAGVYARFTPGFAGKLRKISASVSLVASTSGKASTLTPKIAGTSTTGGALALTSANCTPLGAKVDGSAITAANAFSATDEITLVASSTTTFIEGEVLVYLFVQSA